MSAVNQTAWVFNEEQLQRALEIHAGKVWLANPHDNAAIDKAVSGCKTVSEFLYGPHAKKLRVDPAQPEVSSCKPAS